MAEIHGDPGGGVAVELPARAPGGKIGVPSPDHTCRVLLALIAIGIVLRVLRYLADRSLWLDEAYLANSILTYSPAELLTRPLMHWQAAPPGFLLLEKLAVICFGTSEYALRLVPLLAGLASLGLFYGVIRRVFAPSELHVTRVSNPCRETLESSETHSTQVISGGSDSEAGRAARHGLKTRVTWTSAAQIIAMALFVTLDPLIYYSAEAKQYGFDVMVALAIVWAAMRWREAPRSAARTVTFALIGCTGIFCSHPAIFMLAGVGIVLTVESIRQRNLKSLARLAIIGILWFACFAADYFLFLRPLMHHAGLAAYWAADFMPYSPLPAIKWLGFELYELFHGYATMWLPLVDSAIIATLIGIYWFWRNNRTMLAFLTLPIALTLVAAMVHAYPFGSRLVLFLVPLLVILIGAGGALIWDSFVPGRRFIPALLLLTILLPSAARDLFYVFVTQKREEIKPVLAYIRDHRRPGDSLYVFYLSEVPFEYYEDRFGLSPDRYGLTDMPTILGQSAEHDPSVYRADLARLRGKGRVWILITHPRALGGVDEEQLFPAILNQWGPELDKIQRFNASAMLYELTTQKR